MLAEVGGVDEDGVHLLPLTTSPASASAPRSGWPRGHAVRPAAGWLGRVIDPLARPLDQGTPLAHGPRAYPLPGDTPADGGQLEGSMAARAHLADQLEALERERAARIERLGARRGELKRWESLLERQARRAEAAALRRDQRAIDDLVSARRGRTPRC